MLVQHTENALRDKCAFPVLISTLLKSLKKIPQHFNKAKWMLHQVSIMQTLLLQLPQKIAWISSHLNAIDMKTVYSILIKSDQIIQAVSNLLPLFIFPSFSEQLNNYHTKCNKKTELSLATDYFL